jgi:hypothetical protein
MHLGKALLARLIGSTLENKSPFMAAVELDEDGYP